MKTFRLFSFFTLVILLTACAPATVPQGSIRLNILPEGSGVTLDGQLAGVTPLDIPANPGESHSIRVEHEGFYPLNLDLVVPASGQLKIEQSLVFQPRVEQIATRAALLAWVPAGDLYFVRDEDDGAYLYILSANGVQKINHLGDATYRLETVPGGKHLMSLNFNDLNGPNVTLWENSTAVWQRNGVYAFTWLEEESALLLGAESGQTNFILQKISQDGNAETWQPDQTFWDGDPEIISLSGDGQWLSTQISSVLQIWRRDGSRLSLAIRVDQASESRFSPGKEAVLAYLNANDDLRIINPGIPTDTLLVSNVSFPLRWSPDGKAVLYPTYNTVDGGTSLWRVEINSAAVSLVADAALLPGTAADFALSPDGKRLAYINQAGQLYLITLAQP